MSAPSRSYRRSGWARWGDATRPPLSPTCLLWLLPKDVGFLRLRCLQHLEQRGAGRDPHRGGVAEVPSLQLVDDGVVHLDGGSWEGRGAGWAAGTVPRGTGQERHPRGVWRGELLEGEAVPLGAVVVLSFGDREGCRVGALAVQSRLAASRYDMPTRAGRTWAMAMGWR